MPNQPRFEGQFIAIVRPPAVDAEAECLPMPRPIIADVNSLTPHPGPLLIRWGEGYWSAAVGISERSKQIRWRMIDVQDDFEVQIVQHADALRCERVRVE